jgi:hypothetical protein
MLVRDPKKILTPKRDDITWDEKKLHNEEL